MNDEVSVAELMEREGWTEADRRPRGRLRVLAVMTAVVLGCGLAALMVHIGSHAPEADGPSVLDMPHGPTGGLAGGGVPASPSPTERTDTESTVVVTNQAGPVFAGVPWTTERSASRTKTVTETGPSVTPTTESKSETASTSSTAPGGGIESSTPGNAHPPTTPSNCWLLINWC